MASTPVVQVRRWLRDQFEAVLSGEGVAVHYAFPGKETVGLEAVYFMAARTVNLEPAAHRASKYRREETVVQPFVVAVTGAGMAQEDVDARAVELYGMLDEAAASTTFVQAAAACVTGQQIESLRFTGWEQLSGPFEDGHGCALTVSVEYTARYL